MNSSVFEKRGSSGIDRRHFLKGALVAGAIGCAPNLLLGAGTRRDKVKLACVGIGNRGRDVIRDLHRTGLAEIVALCDTDMGAPHTQDILKQFPKVPRFQDFRKLFDKMGRDFDAVCIATPDFSHFPVAMLAMSQRKHIYVEKPMAHSFRQIELMMAAEKKYGVACQMGNQGHSEANYFQFKTWVDEGIIREVDRITAFMNNPRRWHGMKVDDYFPKEEVPESLDWDTWLATARNHAYNHGYMNGEWRSWFDFGNGALGDWGAHIFDTAHQFLDLGLPVEVEPTLEGYNPLIFPQASTLAFRFPKRGSQPPLELTWYDGTRNLPPLPENFGSAVVDPNIPPPSAGTIDTKAYPPGKVIYGDGLVFKGGSHGSTLEIIGGERAEDVLAHLPEVPKSPSNHAANFLKSAMGEEKCRSNFAVAGPLCQAMAIGIIAQRVNAKLEFDPASKRITNHKLANELLDGVPPRKGWETFYRI
ncbi:Gfo/Idh/MocA family oxidoreductase [Haloferula sargassicola]|uniref:Inositol 2-dehydrogenase/D-chiro-inositol 3-dehydrogenase n=1 Tax=Haloferula sargassicola TaxID=490096 RepID=A0ABP9UL39_9BACT